MLEPEYSTQFKRDYRLALRRGFEPEKLEKVIEMLCNEQPLPAQYRDHALVNSRRYKNMGTVAIGIMIETEPCYNSAV